MLEALKVLYEGFDTLHDYALATIAHWILMGVGGVLILRSHHRGGPVMRLFGAMICALWIVYELAEFSRIHDNFEKDIANGIFGFVVGAILYSIYRAIQRRYGKALKAKITKLRNRGE